MKCTQCQRPVYNNEAICSSCQVINALNNGTFDMSLRHSVMWAARLGMAVPFTLDIVDVKATPSQFTVISNPFDLDVVIKVVADEKTATSGKRTHYLRYARILNPEQASKLKYKLQHTNPITLNLEHWLMAD